MLTISIGHVPRIENYVHKCTSYYLYDTKNVQDAVPIGKWEKSHVFKNCLQEVVGLEEDKDYYVKYIIHMGIFDLDPDTGEDKPYNEKRDGACGTIERIVKVENTKHQTSRMLLKQDVEIEQPMIYVDLEDLNDPDCETVTFRTSQFRGKGDSLKATTWLIEDKFGSVIIGSLEDENNRTQFTVNKEDIIKGHTMLVIRAIHHGTSGVCSPQGVKEQIIGKHNFNIVSNTHSLSPSQDYLLQLEFDDPNKPSGIIKIELRNSTEEEIYWAYLVHNPFAKEFILPWMFFTPGSVLMLNIYAVDDNKVLTVVKKRLQTRDLKVHDIQSSLYKHQLKVTDATFKTIKIPDRFTTMQLRQGYLIPMPTNKDNKLHLFEYSGRDKTFKDTGKIMPGVTTINENNIDTLIRVTEDDYMVIDTYNEQGYPTFLVYKYDMARQVFEILHTKVRKDEKTTTGVNGSLIQADDAKAFFYLPIDTGVIRKYDFIRNEIKVMPKVDIDNPTNGILIPLKNGRILMVAGESFMTKIFIVAEERFVDGIPMRPQSFINRPLTTVQLNNGSTLVVKRDPDPDDEEISMLYFDYHNTKFVQLLKQFSSEDHPYTFIEMLSSELIMSRAAILDRDEEGNPTGSKGSLLTYFS